MHGQLYDEKAAEPNSTSLFKIASLVGSSLVARTTASGDSVTLPFAMADRQDGVSPASAARPASNKRKRRAAKRDRAPSPAQSVALMSDPQEGESPASAARPACNKRKRRAAKLARAPAPAQSVALMSDRQEGVSPASAARPASNKRKLRAAKRARAPSPAQSVTLMADRQEGASPASAAQPAHNKRTRLASSATFPQPRAAKRARAPSSATSVAFITCAQKAQDFARNPDRRALLQAVRNALEAGANIINIAFSMASSKHLVDTGTILQELQSEFDATWSSSVEQPAYSLRRVGSVMSFFSASCGTLLSEEVLDPENQLPALMLTFSAPQGLLCTITTSLPALPQRARARMLNCYADAAVNTKAETILIGGSCHTGVIFMENLVAHLNLPFQLFTNQHLCLLTHTPDCSPMTCFPADTDGPYSFMATWDNSCSVEQPAPCQAVNLSPRQAVKLTPSTPLYDNLIANLEPAVRNHRSGEAFMEYITQCCFFGKLLTLDVYGEPVDTPVPLSVKMEELLRAAKKRRELHMERLRRRGVHIGVHNDMHMDPVNDMKEIYNTWRQDVQSWMRPSTLDTYKEHERNHRWQKAHQLGKTAFSTYLFHLSGCKFLLHKLIELPLISLSSAGSAERPAAILTELIDAYEEHKKTQQYQDAVRVAGQHQAGQLRLSRQVWWAQYNYTQGRKLSQKVRDKDINFLDLADWQDSVFIFRNEPHPLDNNINSQIEVPLAKIS